MKKKTKLLTLLVLAVLIISVMAVTSFATSTSTEATPKGDVLVTDAKGVEKYYPITTNTDGYKHIDVILQDKNKMSDGCTVKILTTEKIMLGANYYIDPVNKNNNLTIDLNGKTLVSPKRIKAQNGSNSLTIKNGTLSFTAINYFIETNASNSPVADDFVLTIDNVKLNGCKNQKYLINCPKGKIVVKNSEINVNSAKNTQIFAVSNVPDIEITNTKINYKSVANGEKIVLINAIYAPVANNEVGNVVLNGITLQGNFSNILRIDSKATKVLTCNLKVGGGSKLINNGSDPVIHSRGTNKVSVNATFADDVKMTNSKIVYDNNNHIKVGFGDGNSQLVPVNDGIYKYRVLPKLTNGDIYVNIDSDVNLIYVLQFEPVDNLKPEVTFTLTTENGNITQKTNGFVMGNGKYAFKFENIDPRYFGDQISVVSTPTPKVLPNADTITVKEYLTTVISNYGTNAELVALASDILRYGAEAQKYTHYKENALVTDGVSGLSEVNNFTVSESVYSTVAENADYKILSSALKLEGELNMVVKFKAKDLAKLVFEVSVNGKDERISVADAKKVGEEYEITFAVNAYEFGDVLSIKLIVNNAVVANVKYSVNSFIFDSKQVPALDNAQELLQSIANYGRSAKNYKNKPVA